MNPQSKLRAARAIAVVLATATLAAFGCSLVVEFDESRIPTTDAGSDAADSAAAETQADTGKPTETGLDDTGTGSETSDTGVVTETSTMMETSVVDTGPEVIPDVPAVDTELPDVATD